MRLRKHFCHGPGQPHRTWPWPCCQVSRRWVISWYDTAANDKLRWPPVRHITQRTQRSTRATRAIHSCPENGSIMVARKVWSCNKWKREVGWGGGRGWADFLAPKWHLKRLIPDMYQCLTGLQLNTSQWNRFIYITPCVITQRTGTHLLACLFQDFVYKPSAVWACMRIIRSNTVIH